MRYHNTNAAAEEQVLVAFRYTRFPDERAATMRKLKATLAELATVIEETTAPSRDALPWFKGAIFGEVRTDKNCLRHNANVLAVTAVEADYDGEEITPEDARDMLEEAGIAALVYTTPSHSPDAPRWRVIAPFSEKLPPAARERHMARLNGVLGGTLDPASFTLSQSYVYGSVIGRPKVRTYLVEGRYLDTADDLDEGAIGRPGRKADGNSSGEKTGRPFRVIRDALMSIPNDDQPYDIWLAIGMALHHETDGDGLEVFREWSERSGKYDADDLERRWKSFGRSTGPQTTAHYIFALAERHGWRDLERMFGLFTDEMVETTVDGYLLDEDGVIRAFTDRYAGELLFDHHAGKWFRFDGYWRREETKLAHHYARETSIDLAKRDAKAKPLKKVGVWEAIERGSRFVREFAVTSDVWNRDKMLLGTPGGTVDLRTGKLRPGRPEDHISRVTAVAPIPLDRFRPARDCPRWLAFLDEALAGDKAAIRCLQQWGGYSLTGETKEQKLVFVYGPGGSGKGTAINTIGDILGDYAVNVGMETLTASKHDRHTTELARLRGARMARASETEKGRAWAENRIKNLTGQDTITARFMRQDDFEFVPEFKLTIFGNNRPSLKDVDAAIMRRFLILPFDHQPARRDPELAEKLKAEWSGVLSWLIVGCLDWQANGLVIPPVMDAATRAYFDAEDTFGLWLADRCEVGPQFADTTEVLWLSWSRYAYGLGEEPGSKLRTFPESLSQRGFVPIKDTKGIRGRGFKGLRVRDDAREDDDTFL